ncbi:spore coat protein GerQ [Bacillus piscicola]|uniref:spore coat protein GerQ n=1 Tax=Bacillus piscicola TaxID=1632684 RepID=UPI001F091631|nr:spore coat protein GerQ [Bacillus piscicola]
MYNYYPYYGGYPVQQQPTQQPVNPGVNQPQPGGIPPIEQSYIENILRLNLGKRANVYMTFEGNSNNQSQVFTGIIDEAGRDHIVLRDEERGRWYLLLMVYLDYVVFEESIDYDYPFEAGNSPYLSQYPPR